MCSFPEYQRHCLKKKKKKKFQSVAEEDDITNRSGQQVIYQVYKYATPGIFFILH